MKSILFVFFCVIAGILMSNVAYSKTITRSCNAYYEISMKGNGGEIITIQMGHFSTKGSCKSSSPSKCREKARNSAHKCMANHWKIPAKADVHWKRCSDNYPIFNQCLKCEIQKRLCRLFNATTLPIQIKAITTGDKRCPQSTLIDKHFTIHCGQ